MRCCRATFLPAWKKGQECRGQRCYSYKTVWLWRVKSPNRTCNKPSWKCEISWLAFDSRRQHWPGWGSISTFGNVPTTLFTPFSHIHCIPNNHLSCIIDSSMQEEICLVEANGQLMSSRYQEITPVILSLIKIHLHMRGEKNETLCAASKKNTCYQAQRRHPLSGTEQRKAPAVRIQHFLHK